MYPCISEPKTKVPADERSVYQLLSNMGVGKEDNTFEFLVTEKTHATLKPKKLFLIFLDHMDFLTKGLTGKLQKYTPISHFSRILLKKTIS